VADSGLTRFLERARRLNRGSRAVSATKSARELLPGDSALGEGLPTANARSSDAIARYLAEVGQEPSAAREVGLTVLQLYQALSEASGRGRGERDVAILFTDLVEFSAWALEAGDEATLKLLRAVNGAVEGEIRARRGIVVKRLGDGHMAAFDDPVDAVHAAWAASERLDEVEVSGYQPRIRSGIHFGRPRRIRGDYLGVDVNIAARVAGAAGAEEVLISEAVYERLGDGEFDVRRRRWFRAKGAPKDLQVFSVSPKA
jgi:adenylate cyclase